MNTIENMLKQNGFLAYAALYDQGGEGFLDIVLEAERSEATSIAIIPVGLLMEGSGYDSINDHYSVIYVKGMQVGDEPMFLGLGGKPYNFGSFKIDRESLEILSNSDYRLKDQKRVKLLSTNDLGKSIAAAWFDCLKDDSFMLTSFLPSEILESEFPEDGRYIHVFKKKTPENK